MSDDGEKRTVSFEGDVSLEAALDYLHALNDALEAGVVYVRSEEAVVALEPATEVSLRVEARVKREKQSIKLSLEWETDEEDVPPVTEHFGISATAPEFTDEVDEEE